MPRQPRREAPSIREAARQVISVTLASFAMAATTAQAAPPRERLTAESVFTRADANHDGKLSRAEVARFPVFAEKFDQLDADHDGVLDLGEFEVGFNAPQ
jgi:Ca2+-binding EF-hand superfamily protein